MKRKPRLIVIAIFLCSFLIVSTQNGLPIAIGLINSPYKIAIYASPPKLIANNAEYSGLTIQLLDALGNPTIAPQDVVVYLTVSDASIITLSTTTITLSKGKGSIIGAATGYHPWAKSTTDPGIATITASAIGLVSGSVMIETMLASSNPIAKFAIYAAPPHLLVQDLCGLAVQLLDASNKLVKAPTGGVTVSLYSNNSMIANPSTSSIKIPAGVSYRIGRPTSYHPWVTTTYISGVVKITANAIGIGAGNVVIKTKGEAPHSLRIYAAPLRMIADGTTFAKITLQLLDKNGNPAIAPTGGIPVSLTCSNSTVINLVEYSAIIAEGKNYWRTYYSYGWKGPRAKVTATPGEATITASSAGLVSGQVTVQTYSAIANTPSKLAIYAEPSKLIPNAVFYDSACSFSYMTVQLLDDNYIPALAPAGGTIVTLGSNDTSAIIVSTSSVTIPAGSYFTSGYGGNHPWCSATSLPSKAEVTATSSGLSSASVVVDTTEVVLPTVPTAITIDLDKYTIQTGESVTVFGRLYVIATSTPITSAPVRLSYSTDGGGTWNYAGTLMTNGTGMYEASGPVPTPGTYHIKAEYAGSGTYLPCSNVSQPLTVTPPLYQTYLFFDFNPNPTSPGQAVEMRGILIYKDQGGSIHPIASALLSISYSLDYGQSWQPAGTLTTQSDGMFSMAFTAPPIGVYLIKIAYAGQPNVYAPATSQNFLISQ